MLVNDCVRNGLWLEWSEPFLIIVIGGYAILYQKLQEVIAFVVKNKNKSITKLLGKIVSKS